MHNIENNMSDCFFKLGMNVRVLVHPKQSPMAPQLRSQSHHQQLHYNNRGKATTPLSELPWWINIACLRIHLQHNTVRAGGIVFIVLSLLGR